MKTTKTQAQVPADIGKKLAWMKTLSRDRELGSGAKSVAFALMTIHDNATGRCNPSQDYIAWASGVNRQAVSRSLDKLEKAGWIERVPNAGKRLDYILNVDRAKVEKWSPESGDDDTEAAPDGLVEQSEGPAGEADVYGAAYSTCTLERTPPVRSSVQHVYGPAYTILPSDLPSVSPRESSLPSPVTSDPAIDGPAEAAAPAVQPVPVPPMPANDDKPVEKKGEDDIEFAGMKIPGATFRQWEDAFTDISFRAELVGLVGWAIKSVKPDDRIRAIGNALRKKAAAAFEARKDRKDAKAVDAEAGVERCWTNGRIKGTPKTSRFQL